MFIKKKFLIILMFIAFSFKSYSAEEYTCEFDQYITNTITTERSLKSWIPKNVSFIIDNDQISFELKGRRYPAQVTQNDQSRISFIFLRDVKSRKGNRATMRYSGVFFKSNNKFSMSGKPSGYAHLGDAWGKCEINYFQSQNTSSKTNVTNNEILSSNWMLARSSSSTDIFINNSESAILIKSANKMYSKIHQKHQTNKNTDVRYGILWKDEKVDGGVKRYMFDVKRPTKVVSGMEGFIKTLYFEFNDVASILSNKKKFMYFLVTDYDEGSWFATRTTEK